MNWKECVQPHIKYNGGYKNLRDTMPACRTCSMTTEIIHAHIGLGQCIRGILAAITNTPHNAGGLT